MLGVGHSYLLGLRMAVIAATRYTVYDVKEGGRSDEEICRRDHNR